MRFDKNSVFRVSLIAGAIMSIGLAQGAYAQAFSAGNLIVSRTVYDGVAGTVTVGQALPGGGTAIANGLFPNVFKNETPDKSFGVTSSIFLDQYTTGGAKLTTLGIDNSATGMTTSFASKSELGLNISTDGSSVTFMGYKAPTNTLDVSNSNTTQAFDSTNPVTSTFARAIGDVNLNTGAVQITSVNAYSGNNGRAVVNANGVYYMVGNAGNGNGNGTSLSQLSDNTGVQSILVGNSGNTSAVGIAQGTFGQSNGYQRGFALQQLPAYALTPDKTGKDDNFRGMTIYNGTMYVTKGSGSNGVNTVYQVGANGALSNGNTLNNATTAITILPGFNTQSEKVAEATLPGTTTPANATQHPFGLFFGDDTTLFVADEGDGVRLGAAGKFTNFAGLQEWKLVNGNWGLVNTFQHGLLDQPLYTGGLPWNVKTDGLRNITGRKNADGSFSIFATTSTVSDETTHDLGADPNEIVEIDVAADGTSNGFNVLATAAFGERFGGVALAPVPEPETYALLLAGLGLLGFTARRKKQQDA